MIREPNLLYSDMDIKNIYVRSSEADEVASLFAKVVFFLGYVVVGFSLSVYIR